MSRVYPGWQKHISFVIVVLYIKRSMHLLDMLEDYSGHLTGFCYVDSPIYTQIKLFPTSHVTHLAFHSNLSFATKTIDGLEGNWGVGNWGVGRWGGVFYGFHELELSANVLGWGRKTNRKA